MTNHCIQLANVAAVPWKNGGGLTRELLAWPSPDAWVLRLSVAQIDKSGPFSIFAGVKRWFGVLTGAGVRLSVDSHTQVITRDMPLFEFDGGLLCDCDLIEGSTSDLNIMIKDNAALSRAQRVKQDYQTQLTKRSIFAVFANGDQTMIRSMDDSVKPILLQQGDLYWQILASSDAPLQVMSKDAICVELEIE